MRRDDTPLQKFQVALDAKNVELNISGVAYENDMNVLETKITELEDTPAKERAEHIETICRLAKLIPSVPIPLSSHCMCCVVVFSYCFHLSPALMFLL